jgi:hypothetical protein
MHAALRKSLLKTVFKFLINPKNRLNTANTKNQKTKKLALWSSSSSPPSLKTAKTKQWFSARLQIMLGPTVWRL